MPGCTTTRSSSASRRDDTETLRAFTRPIAAAFGDDYTDAMFEVDRQAWELDRMVGALDGETWVGGGSADSVRLTVPGGAEVRAAAITGVGVSPTHRRRGILTRIMRWLIDQAADRGEPLAVLHASEGAIYPRFGFGLGTLQGTVDIERSISGLPPRSNRSGACASSSLTKRCG